ncbi:MAG: beta-propeller domain-containing protein [Gammaproteobacteria bacterium]
MKKDSNRRNRLVLAAAAAGTLGLSMAQAQDLATANVLQGSGSISVAKPHRYADVIVEGDAVSAQFTFAPQAGDVGKRADLYIVARIGDGDTAQSWALASDGKWQVWNGDIRSLPVYGSKVLQASETLALLSEQELYAGDYTVHVGYRAGGALVYSQQPLQFSVAAVETDSLQRFVSAEAMEAYIKESLLNGSDYGTHPELLRFATTTAAPSLDAAGSRMSTTNLQEGGVDEADTIKVNDDTLFMLAACDTGACLQVQRLDSAGPGATLLSTVRLDSEQNPQGMYFVDDGILGQDMLVIVGGQGGGHWLWRSIWGGWQNSKTELNFLSVSSPANVTSIETLTFDGALVSSRVVGDTLYLVTRYTPAIEGFQPYPVAKDDEARNAALVEATTLPDILPRVIDSRDEVTALVEGKDCYLPVSAVDGSLNPSIVTITGISLKDPTKFESTCFLGSSETLYMTPDALYLATTSWDYDVRALDNLVYASEHTTAIHKFALTAGGIDYRGSGTVKGHLGWHEDKKSFRMGANGAYLNVATSIGDTWDDSSSTRLTVLKEADGKRLETVSVIDGIGKPGEQLYAARFLGDRAYLVTFRLTDPLYVVDLSAQEQPKLAGELEIDGYSEYLHPISDTLLLGIGKDAIAASGQGDILGGRSGAFYQGVKLALFDVSDPAKPREIDSKVLGKRGTESEVLYDHHAFSYLPAQGSEPARFAIPVQLHDRTPTWPGYDASSPQAWYDYTHTGLYSFEVGPQGITQAGRIIAETADLRDQPARGGAIDGRIATSLIAPIYTWYGDRSVLKDDAVFYVHDGKVLGSLWGENEP